MKNLTILQWTLLIFLLYPVAICLVILDWVKRPIERLYDWLGDSIITKEDEIL